MYMVRINKIILQAVQDWAIAAEEAKPDPWGQCPACSGTNMDQMIDDSYYCPDCKVTYSLADLKQCVRNRVELALQDRCLHLSGMTWQCNKSELIEVIKV